MIALCDKSKKVNYILADDEGHGFRKPVNMAIYAETEKFLSEVIGGRYQKDMPFICKKYNLFKQKRPPL